MQNFTFRPHKSFGGEYIETDTFADMQLHLRQYKPASSTYRAIKLAGEEHYTVLYLSDYIQGPVIAGYMRMGG